MAIIERTYNVPLRNGFINTPKHKKTKKAVSVLKNFLSRHMKAELDNVYIGKNLNLELWKHGIKNPPHHVKVVVTKDDKGIVKAELSGFKYTHVKKDQKDQKETTTKDAKGTLSESKSKEKTKKSMTDKEELKHEHGHEHPEGHVHTHDHPKAEAPHGSDHTVKTPASGTKRATGKQSE